MARKIDNFAGFPAPALAHELGLQINYTRKQKSRIALHKLLEPPSHVLTTLPFCLYILDDLVR